ncbi:MAG: hypothetical protein OEV92_12960 [Nitrospinota bacterium]|nr:hypothetical protein [Nitrospinota bacterium]
MSRLDIFRAALAAILLAMMALPMGAWATPSLQVVIPSADTVPQLGIHLDVDNTTTIFTKKSEGGHANPVNMGLTVGILESRKFGLEGGLDIREQSDFPLSYNFKILIREGALHYLSPAVAFGMYQIGSAKAQADFDIAYGLVSKTFPALGRLSAGLYIGSQTRLVNRDGEAENAGLMASFDRTLAEIDGRLWLVVDYMSGDNALGALSLGLAYRFVMPPGPGVSATLGYNIYNDKRIAGENTITLQFDIDLNQDW